MRQKKTLKLDSVFALCFCEQGSFGSEIDSVFTGSREVQVGGHSGAGAGMGSL